MHNGPPNLVMFWWILQGFMRPHFCSTVRVIHSKIFLNIAQVFCSLLRGVLQLAFQFCGSHNFLAKWSPRTDIFWSILWQLCGLQTNSAAWWIDRILVFRIWYFCPSCNNLCGSYFLSVASKSRRRILLSSP